MTNNQRRRDMPGPERTRVITVTEGKKVTTCSVHLNVLDTESVKQYEFTLETKQEPGVDSDQTSTSVVKIKDPTTKETLGSIDETGRLIVTDEHHKPQIEELLREVRKFQVLSVLQAIASNEQEPTALAALFQ